MICEPLLRSILSHTFSTENSQMRGLTGLPALPRWTCLSMSIHHVRSVIAASKRAAENAREPLGIGCATRPAPVRSRPHVSSYGAVRGSEGRRQARGLLLQRRRDEHVAVRLDDLMHAYSHVHRCTHTFEDQNTADRRHARNDAWNPDPTD